MLVVAAIAIGVVFSYSLSTYITMQNDYPSIHFVLRQFVTALFCIVLIGFISRLEADKWLGTIGFSIFFISLLLMAAMPLLPSSLVPLVNGAKRWIKLGPLSLSAVEFFKIGFVYFLAWSFTRKFYLADRPPTLLDELKIFSPYLAVFLLVAFLIVVMQNDLGQAIVLSMTLAVMLLFAGSSFKLFLSLLLAATAGGIGFILYSSYRLNKVLQWWAGVQDYILSMLPTRLADYLRVESDALDEAYQVTQSLNAIHNGGIFGTGIGNGVYKLGYVSDVHTDFVLAGIIEEAGLVGAAVIASLILALVFRIFKVANRSENPVHYLFCVGIASIISFQFLMNSLGISGIVPIKGITVPFVSYGGSSMMALSLAIGMVIMISKKIKA